MIWLVASHYRDTQDVANTEVDLDVYVYVQNEWSGIKNLKFMSDSLGGNSSAVRWLR